MTRSVNFRHHASGSRGSGGFHPVGRGRLGSVRSLAFVLPILYGCGTAGPDEDIAETTQAATSTPPPGKTNIALGASTSESSPGWGGGSYPQEIVDGEVSYSDTWAHGLAFKGGPKEWAGEPCGERQAVVDFGTPKTFDLARVWHHGPYSEHVPTVYRLEYWDGTAWQPTGGTSTVRWDLDSAVNGAWGAVPTEHQFPKVTASKLRFVLDNCPMTGDGHGWIYEFEVFSASNLEIVEAKLNDIDDTPLQYISADEHPYFGGSTRVHGTIKVKGTPGDELDELTVEVVQGDTVRASADLSPAAASQLLGVFGSDGELSIASSSLLFEIPSTELGALDDGANGEVTLRLRASTVAGDEDEADAVTVPKLVRYAGINRYGSGSDPRDGDQGGDDWVKPTVRQALESMQGMLWGDMSNMNGGIFRPHNDHRTGNSADGWFQAYSVLRNPGPSAGDRAAAQALVGLLNEPSYGPRISRIFVSNAPRHPTFWQIIRNTQLQDGRAASTIVQAWPNHRTHFHITIDD